jgi:signal transduction histidine kinase
MDWREMTLSRVLGLVLAGGVIVLGTLLVMRPAPRFDAATLAIALGIVAVAVVRRLPGLPLAARVWVAIAALTVAAVSPMAQLGLLLGSGLTLAVAALLATLVLGRRAGLAVTATSAALVLLVGLLVTSGVLEPVAGAIDPRHFINWLRSAVSLAAITPVAVFLVDLVVRQLSRQYATAAGAVARLETEGQVRQAREEVLARGLGSLRRLALSEVVESGRLAAALAEITEAGSEAVGTDRCGIWLLDEAGARLRCFDLYERSSGRHSRGQELAAADYPEYFATLAGERVLSAEDAQHDPRTRAMVPAYLGPLGIGAMLDATIRHGDRVAGVVCHEHVGERRHFSHELSGFAGSIADFAARALAAADRTRQEQALREAYDQAGQLHRRLEGAKEEERRALAHELHDEMGQSLTALKLRLAMLGKTNPGVDVVEPLRVLDELIAQVRRVSLDLRPPLLDEVGLGPALRRYLEVQSTRCGLPIIFHEGEVGRLPAEIEIGAFRLVQEALTNTLRHAGATRAEVEVKREGDTLHLQVRDDGRGFDVEAARRGATRGAHFGLVSMRERLRGLGGSLDLRSTPGQGTVVEARLPLR